MASNVMLGWMTAADATSRSKTRLSPATPRPETVTSSPSLGEGAPEDPGGSRGLRIHGGTRHPLGLDFPIELVRCEISQRYGSFAERRALAVRLLGDLGSAVVAEPRCKGRDEHERALQLLPDAREVRLEAAGTVLLERLARVGE